jgi:hypothetical protein
MLLWPNACGRGQRLRLIVYVPACHFATKTCAEGRKPCRRRPQRAQSGPTYETFAGYQQDRQAAGWSL